jgi:hypothetical protein
VNARSQLLELYHQWKELSEFEGIAILAANWNEVSRCQSGKAALQYGIITAHELLQKELSPGISDPRVTDPQIRSIVTELILLEQRNGQWLDEQEEKAQEQNRALSKTSKNLRAVHKAYVSPQACVWHSYS